MININEFKANHRSTQAWLDFMGNQDNRGHATRVWSGSDVTAHIDACMASAREAARRVARRLPHQQPQRILEIGCSTGVNCIALAEQFPQAQVWGVEPESEALQVATAMNQEVERVRFYCGGGESLPFPDSHFDLIVCHTVLEHVGNVRTCVKEMARVLAKGGTISLEAPNYRFPYEPHLAILCIPRLGKGWARVCAGLQGCRKAGFLEHLQFITTPEVIDLFRKQRLSVHDEAEDKIHALLDGRAHGSAVYGTAASILAVCKRLGLASAVAGLITRLAIFPSMLLVVRRPSHP